MRIAMAMANRTLAPGEVAPMRHLYVVSRGLVLFGGKVLSYGHSWGDDVILTDARYFLPFLARAMTYVDIKYLSREALLDIVVAFPASAIRLRKRQIQLAFRRHVIQESRAIRDADIGTHRRASKEDFLSRMSSEQQRKHTSTMIAAALEESAHHRRALSPNHVSPPHHGKNSPGGHLPIAAGVVHGAEGQVDERMIQEMRGEMAEGLRKVQADVSGLHTAIAKLTATVEAISGQQQAAS